MIGEQPWFLKQMREIRDNNFNVSLPDGILIKLLPWWALNVVTIIGMIILINAFKSYKLI